MSDHPGIWYPPFRVMGLDDMMASNVKRAASEHINFNIFAKYYRNADDGS